MRLFVSALLLGGIASSSVVPLQGPRPPVGRSLSSQLNAATSLLDQKWDAVINGADVLESDLLQGIPRWLGGDLTSYALRTRSVDPGSLKVDTVKQYSGYLDNKISDKHLFYCRFSAVYRRVQSSR